MRSSLPAATARCRDPISVRRPDSRVPAFRFAALLVLAAAVLGAGCGGRGGQAPTATHSPEAGVHVFLWGSFDTSARDLKLARDGGFTWVKQRFEWRYIEGGAKGRFEWNEPDRIMKAIDDAGLKVVARLDNQPAWARSDGVFPVTAPPDRLSDWTDFVSALATRYQGRIDAYEIWNEPTLAGEWGGKPPSAAEYTRLLKASYGAIKKVDPQALVITAGLSPTTDLSPQARPDVMFLREMYAAGAKGTFDLLGVHAAGFKAEPEADPGTVAQNPALTNNDPSTTELKRVYTFRHAEDLRQVMVEQGDADRKVAILEMGWTSDNRPNSPYLWHSVTEEQKADYLVRAFKYAWANWPWASFMSAIYLPDPAWTRDQEQLYWSITNPDGTPRAAYRALQGALRG